MNSGHPSDRPTPAPREFGRDDRIGLPDRARRLAYRSRGWVLCRLGRHYWASHRNPEVGGARAVYELCRRCGRERDTFEPPRRANWLAGGG